MRILFASAIIASAGLIAAVSSHAMPLGPVHQDGMSSIIQVHGGDGCGPRRHRGPGGHCRPRFSCPRGWHSGPAGWHCFRNF